MTRMSVWLSGVRLATRSDWSPAQFTSTLAVT